MPYSNYLDTQLNKLVFGGTGFTPAGTLYVGLVFQCGTLSTALTAGTSYTSLACTTNPVGYAIGANDVLLIGSGATQQVVTASSSAAVNATSVSVNSFIANAAYGVGTPFIRCDVYATAQEPSGANYARQAVTNSTGNWSPVSSQPLAGQEQQNAAAISFPATPGTGGYSLPVAGFLVGDNATPGSGNVYAYGLLTSVVTIGASTTPSFAIGALLALLN